MSQTMQQQVVLVHQKPGLSLQANDTASECAKQRHQSTSRSVRWAPDESTLWAPVRASPTSKQLHVLVSTLGYHLYSIFLFTFSDIKTIIAPSTLFAVLQGLASLRANPQSTTSDLLLWVGCRAPIGAFWAWINLLPFAIDNQRQHEAILEDAQNKPWRTMPSKRMTPEAATKLMFILYPCAIISSYFIGGLWQCLALVVLGYWYNDKGGADDSWVIRNLINGCGFVCYTSGAFAVAMGNNVSNADPRTGPFFLIMFLIVFTTVHTQDMYDQAGDSQRNRKTVPLSVGDAPARWMIALAMPLLAGLCLWYWGTPTTVVSGTANALQLLLAGSVAIRTLAKRTVKADKATFRLWNLWLVSIYALPLANTR